MKLETAHTEKENMSYDLRMEVESLRKEVAHRSEALKVANSNKQGIIGELMEQTDQNLKLANQLHEVRSFQSQRSFFYDLQMMSLNSLKGSKLRGANSASLAVWTS